MLLFSTLLLAPDLKATAQANVAAFHRAILARDAGWFEKNLTPGFTQRVDGQTLDRRAALAQIKGGLLRMKIGGLTATLVRVRPAAKGYAATVGWRGTMRATLQGKPATLVATWTDEQTWVRTPAGWRLSLLDTHGFERTISR